MRAPVIQLGAGGVFAAEGDRQRLHDAVASGGLVVFPTDTIYGLGCDAFHAEAVERIYQLKGRPSDQPLSVHLASVQELGRYAEIDDAKWARIERLLPGPYTVILAASAKAPSRCVSADGKIGLRVPESTAFQAVSEAAGCPLVGTSVNRSGEPSLIDIDAIREQFSDEVELMVATPAPLSGAGSTVIDLTVEPPVALRGELPSDWRV